MNERHVGGLWCHEVLEGLDAYVDGSLSPDALVAVQAHVAECTECARFGAAYARLVGALRPGDVDALGDARQRRLAERLGQIP